MKIKSRNVWKKDTTSNTTSLCLLNKPTTYRQHSRRRRRFNCVIMRKKLTPIFRQISDAATPKLVKRMAEMIPFHSLLDKLLEGLRRRIQAASLACCSSWSIVFHELILPLTELRHIPPFTEPVWATQMVSSALVRRCCLFIVVSLLFFLLVIRWNPDLFFVGPFPNDVGFSRSCFPEKKSKKSDSIDCLWPNSYDGIGKMARFN